jgi:hypothetical protein
MVVRIKKNDSKKDISEAMKQMKKKKNAPKLSDFNGKLKGVFGDGLTYQKEIRNEWD